MRKQTKVSLCIGSNATTVILLFFMLNVFNREGSGNLWQFGPSDDLFLLSIPINTWVKYWLVVVMIGLIKISEVLVNDFASPDVYFATFDTDRKKIYGFTRLSLQILTGIQSLSNDLGNIFKTIILVTRLDIALISVFIQNLTGVVSIYLLLSKKTFYPDIDHPDDDVDQVFY